MKTLSIFLVSLFIYSSAYSQNKYEFPSSSALENVKTEIAKLAMLEIEYDSLKILANMFDRSSDYIMEEINVKLVATYYMTKTTRTSVGTGWGVLTEPVPDSENELKLEFTLTDNQVRELIEIQAEKVKQKIIELRAEIRKRIGIK